MISVVVFFYSNTLQSMCMDYAGIEMVCFDDYSDAATHAKTMRGNGITTFFFAFYPMYHFQLHRIVTATLITEASLKLLYSRLGFKVIKYFATSPNFEKSFKQFNYKSGISKQLQKKTIGSQFI